MLVHTVREQDKTLSNMKRALDDSAAEQVASLHELHKVVRQHSVDKNDAIQDAKKAKVDLAVVVKKADQLMNKLERNVHDLTQGKLAMAANVEERVEAMNVEARAMARDKRELQLHQAEVLEQKVIRDKQLESLAYQRSLTLTERKKIKTTHLKTLDHLQSTSVQDKQVRIFGLLSTFLVFVVR